MQIIALLNGTPIDTAKLQEIFSLKETSFIGIVITLCIFYYTYKKEKESFDLKIKEIKELKIRLNKRRKQRQEQKKRKRGDKRRKKDAQKNRKKS